MSERSIFTHVQGACAKANHAVITDIASVNVFSLLLVRMLTQDNMSFVSFGTNPSGKTGCSVLHAILPSYFRPIWTIV